MRLSIGRVENGVPFDLVDGHFPASSEEAEQFSA